MLLCLFATVIDALPLQKLLQPVGGSGDDDVNDGTQSMLCGADKSFGLDLERDDHLQSCILRFSKRQ